MCNLPDLCLLQSSSQHLEMGWGQNSHVFVQFEQKLGLTVCGLSNFDSIDFFILLGHFNFLKNQNL